MTSPLLLTTSLIEATLYLLYSGLEMNDAARDYRAALATELHVRTGNWFAARFY